MNNRVLYYFYSPTWDYPPNGPIKLGNILTSIKKPERALYTAAPPTDDKVVSLKKEVVYCKEQHNAGSISILTKFLSFLGLGVDVGTDWEHGNEEVFTFESVETTQFIPSPTYLAECLAAPSVHRYLEKSRYRKPVYIITGLKIVTGMKANTTKFRAIGGKVGVEVDGTIWSGGTVPVGGGPELSSKRETKTTSTWEDHGDIVFAYKASKVWIKKADVMEEDYVKGAMLGKGEERVQRTLPEVDRQQEAEPEAEGLVTEEIVDGDKTFVCGIPDMGRTDNE